MYYSDGFQWYDLGSPIQGPTGADGTDGTNGQDGAPGTNGQGWTGTTIIDTVWSSSNPKQFNPNNQGVLSMQSSLGSEHQNR